MLTESSKKMREKQGYRPIGTHSAVKTCHYTKQTIKGMGGCYKRTFYGIQSNQCMQMTTSMSCANRCMFCWRTSHKASASEKWIWPVDDPNFILEKSLKAHHDLLSGFNNNPKIDMAAYQASKNVKHAAISLDGEPITYPQINELTRMCHQQGISTFIVTNGQFPESVRNLNPITQLYISIDAPNSELLKEIDNPVFTDYWERLHQSQAYMAEKQHRTCNRLTLIKGRNMVEPQAYAELIKKGNPDFVEAKGYSWLGGSRARLNKEHMPYHKEVVEFAQALEQALPDYTLVSQHVQSRVVMLAKKTFKKDRWWTWIDFDTYHELAISGKPFTALDYVQPTPPENILSTADIV